ncbi:MAG: hypothetical protein P8184_19905 [Calditrichia bacterium]
MSEKDEFGAYAAIILAYVDIKQACESEIIQQRSLLAIQQLCLAVSRGEK